MPVTERGIAESCVPGDHESLDRIVTDLRECALDFLRLEVPVSSWSAANGRQWYAQVIRGCSEHGDVLPTLRPEADAPELLVDAVHGILRDTGTACRALELWVSPAPVSVWEHAATFQDRLRLNLESAVAAAARAGREVVLGLAGPACTEQALLSLAQLECMSSISGLLVDCINDRADADYDELLQRLRRLTGVTRVWLAAGAPPGRVLSCGEEIRAHARAGSALADRLYWRQQKYSLLQRLRCRLNEKRFESIAGPQVAPAPSGRERVLVTGGAGFVGCNLVARLAAQGREVIVLDNLHRRGVEQNLEWLLDLCGPKVAYVPGDIRDPVSIRDALQGVSRVFHLAGQVAVTSSLDRPLEDFEVNARGTLNLLEEIRRLPNPPGVIFTSTNKVYGDLKDVELREQELRHEPSDAKLREAGVAENRNLDLHSPYGCSKGTGDQYVLDYARSYGIPSLVFRMSCIYGPRQFGTEDQGWVAHFLLRALSGAPITIYGDGKQVRDILFIDDLIDAFLIASERLDRFSGQAFNMGGGPPNAISLLELCAAIAAMVGRAPELHFAAWRRGDQRYYVSDTSRFRSVSGWQPRVDVSTGLERLHSWLQGLLTPSRGAESLGRVDVSATPPR